MNTEITVYTEINGGNIAAKLQKITDSLISLKLSRGGNVIEVHDATQFALDILAMADKMTDMAEEL